MLSPYLACEALQKNIHKKFKIFHLTHQYCQQINGLRILLLPVLARLVITYIHVIGCYVFMFTYNLGLHTVQHSVGYIQQVSLFRLPNQLPTHNNQYSQQMYMRKLLMYYRNNQISYKHKTMTTSFQHLQTDR